MHSIRLLEYKKKENELCARIGQLTQKLELLEDAEKQRTETYRLLEAALEEFETLRSEAKAFDKSL